jgi:hypothetical protein
MNRSRSDRSEEEFLDYAISDEALEAAGLGRKSASADTHPFAIICIPFGPRAAKRHGD